ncbi:MAG: hypothetical protein E7343_05515 [Clostridiales bacterium]|nr:hypothetical protein [Clostridiales bacterium]
MEKNNEKFTIEEVLEKTGVYVGPTVGVSMLPMLKNRRDSVIVVKKTERLKPLDVALYKRGNDYVLHRVLEVKEWGYIIRGDNCYSNENVPEDTVIGVLREFYRKDKHVICTNEKYLRYAKRRIATYPVRRVFFVIKQKLYGLARKIIKKKK